MARGFDAAVMHDFFVDRLVHLSDLKGFLGSVEEKSRSGGGGIHGVRQSEMRGGNAVNLANALARLGLRVLLLTHSDGAHEGMLREAFRGLDAELRVKPFPPGLTVAFEERANVMVADCGGAAAFGPEALDEADWDALRSSRVVCCVNWAANMRGTALLESLRARLGKGKTVFLDPADVRDRLGEYRALLQKVREGRLADWMSMNEFEASATAGLLGVKAAGGPERCRLIASELSLSLDVHGEEESATSDGGSPVVVGVKRVSPRRRTGAGDVWDAASIYGRLTGMAPLERLELANRAAGLYLTAEEPTPPLLRELTGRAT